MFGEPFGLRTTYSAHLHHFVNTLCANQDKFYVNNQLKIKVNDRWILKKRDFIRAWLEKKILDFFYKKNAAYLFQ